MATTIQISDTRVIVLEEAANEIDIVRPVDYPGNQVLATPVTYRITNLSTIDINAIQAGGKHQKLLAGEQFDIQFTQRAVVRRTDATSTVVAPLTIQFLG